jgi:DNA-binding transcriptional LysR family regulator
VVAGINQGLEASVQLCVDALFPLRALADLCAAFARQFSTVDLRVDTQTMAAVEAAVLDGSASLGVVGPTGLSRGLESHFLATVAMVPVVSREHPLASARGRIPRARLEGAIQIVLAERNEPRTEDQAVLSARTWRIADLHTKRALICAGLGWGNLPAHLVQQDLRRGTLVRIRPEGWSDTEHVLTLSAHRSDAALGPAHRWLIANLGALCARESSPRKR